MSIALFDEPPRVRLALGGEEALMIGVTMDGLTPYGVCVTEDGSLTVVHGSQLNVGWRYNPETDRWADVNAQNSAQEG